MVKLTEHESLSHEDGSAAPGRKMASRPWRKDMWCISEGLMANTSARMEDVLGPLCRKRPIPSGRWCAFDESPVQLIGEARQPIPAEPGRLERYDYEYRRNGTVNLFVFLDVHRPLAQGQSHRAPRRQEDYAHCMRDPSSISIIPDAEIIRIVQDNLSTHSAGSLYQAFPPAEARRILRRIEFHYTPQARKLA